MRLNLGAGGYPVDGYLSVDLLEDADIPGDFTDMDFVAIEAVVMSHSLEHVSHHRTLEVLERIRSWMVPGGDLVVEVPDIDHIRAIDPSAPHWNQWMFGSQEAEGCAHLAGFTVATLRHALVRAGWTVTQVITFASDHPARRGYPCIEAKATA